MPSILSHIAAPIATRIAAGRVIVPRSLLFVGLGLSILPDADVLLLRLGVPYESQFGHRGASHSIIFALAIATIASAVFVRFVKTDFKWTWLFLFISAVSHPLLDTLTNGGHGAALLWPVSEQRIFAPFRPIEVSPLSLRRFLGEPGLRVLFSEIFWIWLPLLAVGFLGWAVFQRQRRKK